MIPRNGSLRLDITAGGPISATPCARKVSEFVEYLLDVLKELGPISAQRMFGGYGIYHNNLMFGLVADDVLYLKADNESKERYTDRGLPQFEYTRNGRSIKMSYFLAPDDILTMAVPCLAHRLLPVGTAASTAEAHQEAAVILEEIIQEVPVPV